MKLRTELMQHPGKVAVDEARVRHKDGSYRWVELTRKNLLEEPSVRAVVFNFRDITERKEADVERTRLETRLRQAEKLEAVGTLPARASVEEFARDVRRDYEVFGRLAKQLGLEPQ